MKRILIVFLFQVALFAQAQFQTNGNAVALVQDTCYRLTQAVNSQNGSVWNVNQVDLTQNFEILADLYFGTSPGGADGIVFAFQQVSASAGTSGGGMGIQGVQPSLFIPFDTYQNGGNTDPIFDHVSINRNGDINHTSVNNLAGPVQASSTNANIEDGMDHLVLIRWLVNANNTQTIEVYFDCVLRVTATDNFIATIFSNNPNVYWGFTAATGGLNNEHRFCFQYVSVLATNLGDQNVCYGDSVQISAPPVGLNYSWTPITGLSNPNIANPMAAPNDTTVYTVAITNICNNALTDSLTVFVLDTNHTSLDTIICEGESIFAGGMMQTTGGVYIDTFPNGNLCDSIVTLNVTVLDTSTKQIDTIICDNQTIVFNGQNITAAGTYRDTLLNSNSCDSFVTLQVVILPADTINIDTTICSAESFIWNGQNINAAGTYTADLLNSVGCDSVVVYTVSQDQVSLVDDMQEICAQDSIFLADDWQNSTGVYIDTFRYAVSNCDSIIRTTTLTVIDTIFVYVDTSICDRDSFFFADEFVTQAGEYWDTIVVPGECDILMRLLLELKPLPAADIEGPETFCIEDGAELFGVSDFPLVNWLPVNSSENPLPITASNTYVFETTDTAGCTGRDTMMSNAVNGCYELQMPTAFSPTADGANDAFGPVNYPETFFRMEVFNRFGELVFSTADPEEGWDGTFKGKDAEIGVYSYSASFQFKPNHSKGDKSGTFTLIR